MKKIGILSMQNIQNCGSVMQAYGLKKLIENQNDVEVYFIDIRSNDNDRQLLEGLLRTDVDSIESKISLYEKIRLKVIWKLQGIKFNKFRKEYLDIEKKANHFDLCVIGSDEVFNCLNSGWWGFTSQLFGDIPEADKIVTYAASCGGTTYEKLTNDIKDRIKDSFRMICRFSVRDDNTKQFVSKLTNKKVSINLDPVLIYNFSNELNNTIPPKVPGRFCLIYAYVNRIHKENEYGEILKFCEKHSLIPVTVCTSQFWCKNNIICSPFEVLKLFQKAEFVITDTFHGTIFSAKYAKKFAVVFRESNYNKLGDLTNRLGIEQHVVKDFSQLELLYAIKKQQEKIDAVIETERNRTMEYLGDCMNGE